MLEIRNGMVIVVVIESATCNWTYCNTVTCKVMEKLLEGHLTGGAPWLGLGEPVGAAYKPTFRSWVRTLIAKASYGTHFMKILKCCEQVEQWRTIEIIQISKISTDFQN